MVRGTQLLLMARNSAFAISAGPYALNNGFPGTVK